jgi:uncharacterized DUF497 family protein
MIDFHVNRYYNKHMQYELDEIKNASNKIKHSVYFNKANIREVRRYEKE